MARTIRNTKLDTPSARAKLPSGENIHWVSISQGCAVGYRKGSKGGAWRAKYVGNGLRKQIVIGPADDTLSSDGIVALSYSDAQKKAQSWFSEMGKIASGEIGHSADAYQCVNDCEQDHYSYSYCQQRCSYNEPKFEQTAPPQTPNIQSYVPAPSPFSSNQNTFPAAPNPYGYGR